VGVPRLSLGTLTTKGTIMTKKEKAQKPTETKEVKPQEEKLAKTTEVKKATGKKKENQPKADPPLAKKSEKKAAVKKTIAKTASRPKIIIHSKRYSALNQLIDKNKTYSIEEAIALAKKTSTTKFEGSIEVHFRLGIDIKKSDQQVRGAIALPHGTGKSKKVAAFVGEGKEEEAKKAGADIAGSIELINQIKQTGKIDFEIAIATPDMMPKLATIARVLGPKGLMPSPKNETITTNLKKTIDEIKKGKINFKNDDTGNIHATIGKSSFDSQKLIENFQTLLGAIKRAKPASAKGIYIKTASINATMGPGISVAVN